MKTKQELLSKFRKLQTIFSIVLFLFILIFFSLTTKFNLKEIQISQWGIEDRFGWIFNNGIIILSLTTFINVYFYIKNHNRIFNKKTLYFLFFFVSFSLFLVGFFPVNKNNIIHNISAFSYFFSYPLSIFLLSHINRKHIIYNEWITHITTSSIMIILPLMFLYFFEGMAISELSHTLMVMFWNLRILIKNKTIN